MDKNTNMRPPALIMLQLIYGDYRILRPEAAFWAAIGLIAQKNSVKSEAVPTERKGVDDDCQKAGILKI